MNTFTRAALTVLVGLVIWFLPHTEAIKPEAVSYTHLIKNPYTYMCTGFVSFL